MKTRNRIVIFLLALLLLGNLGILVSAASADQEVHVTAAPDKENYTMEDTVYVAFTQDAEAAEVPGWDLSVHYDPAQVTWLQEGSANGTGAANVTYVEKTLNDGTKVAQLGGLELEETFTVPAGEVSRLAFKPLKDGEITLTYEWTLLDADYNASAETETVTFAVHSHSYETAVTEPTCTEDGSTTYTCDCGDTYTETIPATGHTCDETGLCSVCGYAHIQITAQPQDVTVAAGEAASVTVEATGEGLTYAWYFKNANGSKFSLTTAFTTNTYSVSMSQARSGRRIYCVITDANGYSVTTDTATLTMATTPLEIVTQPEDVTVEAGEKAEVTVEATGDGLTYAWYYKNAGGSKFSLTTTFTGPTYSVTMTEARSGRQIYCVITDAYGKSVQSETVTLSIFTTPLEIVTQPEDVTVKAGEKAEVTVEATGDGLSYVWYYKNAGASKFTKTTAFTGNAYSLTMTEARDRRQIYCVITDAYGNSVKTDTVTLTMAAALEITAQPEDVTAASGETASVTVEATGEGLTYAWYYKNAGASKFTLTTAFTGNTYSLKMTEARDGRQVYCVVTDAYGNTVTSDVATLRMTAELEITAQPEDVTVASGKTAKVTVEATGEGLTYQWYYRNAEDSEFTLTTSFTGNTYSLKMTAARDGRQVYCVITDASGNSVTSEIATLTMT